jgi:hypothetical protein
VTEVTGTEEPVTVTEDADEAEGEPEPVAEPESEVEGEAEEEPEAKAEPEVKDEPEAEEGEAEAEPEPVAEPEAEAKVEPEPQVKTEGSGFAQEHRGAEPEIQDGPAPGAGPTGAGQDGGAGQVGNDRGDRNEGDNGERGVHRDTTEDDVDPREAPGGDFIQSGKVETTVKGADGREDISHDSKVFSQIGEEDIVVVHSIHSREAKPVIDNSLSSTNIWSRVLRQVADEITADGADSVKAARSILQEESVRLDSGYSPIQPFRQAIANFLQKSTGISSSLNESWIIPTSLNVLLSHVTGRLRDKIQENLVTARWRERVQEVEGDKELTLKFVGAGMLVTALYCIVSLTLCVRRICKKSLKKSASAAAAHEDQGNQRLNASSKAVEALSKQIEGLVSETKRLAENQNSQIRRSEREDFEKSQRRIPSQYSWQVQNRAAERRGADHHELVPLVHSSGM